MSRKIAFYVMTLKGYISLNHFIEVFGAAKISHVIAAQDAQIEQDYYIEIQQLCISNGINFYDVKQSHPSVKDLICIVISWRWMLNCDAGNIIVLHDSLLPRYRGFAPLVSSLINGEKLIGVTALIANGDVDQGDIISQKSLPISFPIKISNAIEMVSTLYCDLVEELGRMILFEGTLRAIPQDDSQASYSLWLDDNDYFIDWSLGADQIKRFIDSVGYPYKGASSILEGRIVRIIDADVVADLKIANRVPGKVFSINAGAPIIVCGEGLLKLNMIYDDQTKNVLLPFKKLRTRFK